LSEKEWKECIAAVEDMEDVESLSPVEAFLRVSVGCVRPVSKISKKAKTQNSL
jgi:hypothetical protein